MTFPAIFPRPSLDECLSVYLSVRFDGRAQESSLLTYLLTYFLLPLFNFTPFSRLTHVYLFSSSCYFPVGSHELHLEFSFLLLGLNERPVRMTDGWSPPDFQGKISGLQFLSLPLLSQTRSEFVSPGAWGIFRPEEFRVRFVFPPRLRSSGERERETEFSTQRNSSAQLTPKLFLSSSPGFLQFFSWSVIDGTGGPARLYGGGGRVD